MAYVRLTLDDVAEDLRGAVKRMPRLPLQFSLVRRLVRWGLRRTPTQAVPGVEIRTIGALRVYLPAERRTRAALLWIHGGGFLIGVPAQNDRLCAETAAALGMIVVAASYRLAPEHPFPAGLDDCRHAWRELRDRAGELDIDPARVVIGGESAGGGLAATLVQRLCDEGERPLAQWLFYPMLDDRTAARRDLDAVQHPIWNNASNRVGWRSYLGGEPGGAVPPYAAGAHRTDLAGLPPAWIGVGSIDLFAAEDRAYADKLAAAGVAATFVEAPGAAHGFVAWAPDAPTSRDFLGRAIAWLAGILAEPGNG
ncbi:alpha/beta hydrolase [Novosphingobium sp. JCM 18896]|uniref:alpha/beta hydrolase n=1 Tax=Novosphingobium sp. JCM 18896 TaxID=2989731 RepID=UPI002221330C|nr:alpha/beta hydrolase [Novosphingobium sp. JCM 18896]MCW1427739.1 alpha/beta hydrolase [Novosphingobium sp. JCM 18896]